MSSSKVLIKTDLFATSISTSKVLPSLDWRQTMFCLLWFTFLLMTVFPDFEFLFVCHLCLFVACGEGWALFFSCYRFTCCPTTNSSFQNIKMKVKVIGTCLLKTIKIPPVPDFLETTWGSTKPSARPYIKTCPGNYFVAYLANLNILWKSGVDSFQLYKSPDLVKTLSRQPAAMQGVQVGLFNAHKSKPFTTPPLLDQYSLD